MVVVCVGVKEVCAPEPRWAPAPAQTHLLPAPLAPSTATRDPRLTRMFTSVSCFLDAPGQVKDT